jgi:hypothetical protein
MPNALHCARCGAHEVERSGVVQPCKCGSRKMEPPVRWNWQERAARAEALAERLAGVLRQVYDGLQLAGTDSPSGVAAAAALDAWAVHRADLDTLEGR